MTEKLKILEHHAEIVFGLKPKDRKKIPGDVNKYVNETLLLPDYHFTKDSKRKMTQAIEQAAIAVLENNFQVIPDFQDKEKTKDNFDLNCLNCLNYSKKICKLGSDEPSVFSKIGRWINGAFDRKNKDHYLEQLRDVSIVNVPKKKLE